MTKDTSAKTQMSGAVRLVELKPGYFLNPDQIVSVRVLPQEDGQAYAIMQLSNGDKINLSREEFSTLTGAEPRQTARLPQKSQAAP